MNKKLKSLFSSILLVIFLLITIDLYNSVKKRPQKINDYTRERLASKQKKEQISLLCIVLTSNASIFKRGEAVWDTWAKKCKKTLFACNCQIESRRKNLTEDNSRLLNKIEFLNLSINESYDLMSEKVLLVVKLAYEKYAKNYNWFLLVDDDTFIFYDNLIKFIETKNSKWPFTYGYNFKTVVESGYHSGGAGTLITHESLKRLHTKIVDKKCEFKEGYGDVALGFCSEIANVKLGHSLDSKGRERFHPLDPNSHFFNLLPDWIVDYAANKVLSGINHSYLKD